MNVQCQRRTQLFTLLTVCFVVLMLSALSSSAHAEEGSLRSMAKATIDATGSTVLLAAWPTAEYESVELHDVAIVDAANNVYAISFRIHATSAWTGGPLWVDVNITLSDKGVQSLEWGDYYAVVKPGSSWEALKELAER